MIMIKKSDDFLRIYTKNVKVHNLRQTVPRITEYTREKKGNSGPNFQRILINFRKKKEKQKSKIPGNILSRSRTSRRLT